MYKDVNQYYLQWPKIMWTVQMSRIREYKNKLWYLCTMKYYTATKNIYKGFL